MCGPRGDPIGGDGGPLYNPYRGCTDIPLLNLEDDIGMRDITNSMINSSKV